MAKWSGKRWRIGIIVAALLISIALISSTTGVIYDWYESCVKNFHSVKCHIVNCTFIPDYTPYISEYQGIVTYEYEPLRLINSYKTNLTDPLGYCYHEHPINTEILCYYDERNFSTFSYDYDCDSNAYTKPILGLSLSLLGVLLCGSLGVIIK